MTNDERIARYEELKAQGASAVKLREVCQLDSSVAAREPKARARHRYVLTVEEARAKMRADFVAGRPVNRWPG